MPIFPLLTANICLLSSYMISQCSETCVTAKVLPQANLYRKMLISPAKLTSYSYMVQYAIDSCTYGEMCHQLQSKKTTA